MGIEETSSFLRSVFELIADSSVATLLTIVGLLLLLLSGALSYIAIKSKPEQMTSLMRSTLFASLIGGMAFSAAGPAVALWGITQTAFRPMRTETAIRNLEENLETKYLIRLISYNPDEKPELGIDRLPKLGPPDQLYSFVASYDELAGYKVTDALEKVGQTYVSGDHVSAIIFRLRTNLYPANARGLLQIIKRVEDSANPAVKLLKPESMSSKQWDGLKATSISSYRVVNFKGNYPTYCLLAREFKCGIPYPAQSYIGGIQRDWHPLGFSQRNPPSEPCDIPPDSYCEFHGWEKAKQDYRKDFGSRVFLIKNLEIKNIPGRILIEFDAPDVQRIPEIGAR